MGAMDDFTKTQKAANDFIETQRQNDAMIRSLASQNMDKTPFILPKMDGHLASGIHERLSKWIADFESHLDNETEIGVRLVNFGQTVTFHLTHFTYWNPSLIRFDGIDGDKHAVQLIQNVSQISILLMRMPKLNDKPKRIGFHAQDDSAEK